MKLIPLHDAHSHDAEVTEESLTVLRPSAQVSAPALPPTHHVYVAKKHLIGDHERGVTLQDFEREFRDPSWKQQVEQAHHALPPPIRPVGRAPILPTHAMVPGSSQMSKLMLRPRGNGMPEQRIVTSVFEEQQARSGGWRDPNDPEIRRLFQALLQQQGFNRG